MPSTTSLSAFGLNCSLKPSSDEPSSTDRLMDEVFAALQRRGVACARERAADHDVKPGVTSDEGPGDAWPALRQRVLDADILVLGTPIWLGQASSVCKRVLERMDAFLSETDDGGRMPSFGRVAIPVVVGNEDGAHHACAQMFQALIDTGFTVAAGASVYWVGEAMHKKDFKDLPETPDVVSQAIDTAVRNAVHLARYLKGNAFPPAGGQ